MRFRFQLRLCKMLLCGVALGMACRGISSAAAEQASAGKDAPDAKIPLTPLGYQVAPAHILLTNGYVVSSLNYVDAHHILFTFNDRKLIHRQAEDSAEDHPQLVDAVLLEVPSGKVVAQTQWRLHDHGKYIWQLGQGVMLLRLGRELRLLTPLADGPEQALKGRLLLTLPGQASNVEISPDGRMAMLEADVVVAGSEQKRPLQTPSSADADADPAKEPDTVAQHGTDMQFVEFDLTKAEQGKVIARRMAHSSLPSAVAFPLLHDGYVTAQEVFQYPNDWDLVYRRLDGSETALGDVVSTCRPNLEFLSNREMYVVTCNGSATSLTMTVVTLDKQELWQHGLPGDGSEFVVRSAPGGGRFVVSRILSDSSLGVDVLMESLVHGQRIEVHDVKNGALVASVDALPAERAAENFALSSDGRQLAVLQNDAIALYNLAPIQDFPPPKIKPKDLIFVPAKEPTPATKAVAAEAKSANAPVAASAAVAAPGLAMAAAAGGDASQAPAIVASPAEEKPAAIVVPLNVDARRQRPTLYTPEEQKSREKKQADTLPLKQDTAQP